MCPLTNQPCDRECPWWIELTIDLGKNNEHKQGGCAIAWLPTLLIELRVSLDKRKEKE